MGKQKLVVVALITDDEGKILLQKRHDEKFLDAHEKWEFPGGKVDFGESAEEAIVRECKEEIGCAVAITRLLPMVCSRIWQQTDGERVQAFVLCFLVHITSGKPVPEHGKVSDIKWFKEKELDALDLLPGIKEFILSAKK